MTSAARRRWLAWAATLSIAASTVATSARAEPPADEGGVTIDPTPAPLEAPSPAIATGAAAPARSGPLCEPGFAARLYRENRAKLVVVERPEGGLGAGFIFHSRKHVLTALHVVETSRYARVVLADGTAQTGEVVAVDSAHDVALLELERAQGEDPILPRQHVEPGWPIIALGHPYGTLSEKDFKGVLKYSVSQGIVSAVNDDHLQTDTLIAPGNSGGPMLTCDGRVIAVSSQVLADRIGFGVPILYGVHLTGRAKHLSAFVGLPHPDDGSVGLFTQQERTANYYGVYGGSSLVVGNFAVLTHMGLGLATRPDAVSSLTSFVRARGVLELAMGYRAALLRYTKFPMSITVAGGATFYLDRGSETEPVLVYDAPGCPQSGASCAPRLAARESTYKGGGALLGPQIRVRLPQRILPFELSYAWQIDTRSVPLSAHRVSIGLPF